MVYEPNLIRLRMEPKHSSSIDESNLYQRQGKAVTNFKRTLSKPASQLARQLLKDPYNFDFLTLQNEAIERDIERGLLEHIRSFLLELGMGFAFVGSQYPLQVGSRDFYIDLALFYIPLALLCDYRAQNRGLSARNSPEKMNFYLSAADDLLRHHNDRPNVELFCVNRKTTLATRICPPGCAQTDRISDTD